MPSTPTFVDTGKSDPINWTAHADTNARNISILKNALQHAMKHSRQEGPLYAVFSGGSGAVDSFLNSRNHSPGNPIGRSYHLEPQGELIYYITETDSKTGKSKKVRTRSATPDFLVTLQENGSRVPLSFLEIKTLFFDDDDTEHTLENWMSYHPSALNQLVLEANITQSLYQLLVGLNEGTSTDVKGDESVDTNRNTTAAHVETGESEHGTATQASVLEELRIIHIHVDGPFYTALEVTIPAKALKRPPPKGSGPMNRQTMVGGGYMRREWIKPILVNRPMYHPSPLRLRNDFVRLLLWVEQGLHTETERSRVVFHDDLPEFYTVQNPEPQLPPSLRHIDNPDVVQNHFDYFNTALTLYFEMDRNPEKASLVASHEPPSPAPPASPESKDSPYPYTHTLPSDHHVNDRMLRPSTVKKRVASQPLKLPDPPNHRTDADIDGEDILQSRRRQFLQGPANASSLFSTVTDGAAEEQRSAPGMVSSHQRRRLGGDTVTLPETGAGSSQMRGRKTAKK